MNVGDIRNGRIELNMSGRITEETARTWSRRVVPLPGDVVFGYEAKIGEAAVLTQDHRWALGRRVGLLRPRANVIDSRFLAYSWYSSAFQNLLHAKKISGSTIESIRLTELPKWQISLPPLPTQRAIAHILGTLDDKIELNRKMNETLEAIAKALFKSWFIDFDPVRAKMDGKKPSGMDDATAELFPSEFVDSELGKIPKGWEVKRIGDCCEHIQNGGTPRRNESRFWDGGDIPWLTSGEVRQAIITTTGNFITAAGLAESSAKWVSPLSTVIALYGATAGQVSLVTSQLTTNQAVCALIPRRDFAFLNYLWMRTATDDLESKAVGSAQQNISKAIVEETLVVVPSLPIVRRFSESVGPSIYRLIFNINHSRLLMGVRDTLLPKLISGALQVKSAKN